MYACMYACKEGDWVKVVPKLGTTDVPKLNDFFWLIDDLLLLKC